MRGELFVNAFRKITALMVVALLIGALMPLGAFAGEVTAQVVAPKDAYESDDTSATATVYDPDTMGNTWTSMHTFHDLGENDGTSEQTDYVKVTVEETGTPIFVETQRLGKSFYDAMLYIEEADGTQLAYNDDSSVWWETYSSNVYLKAPKPGDYFIRVENNGDNSYSYLLHVTLGDARRVAGDTRISTAVEVTSLMYNAIDNPTYGTDYGPNKILIANAYTPWDALAGGASAAASLDDGSVLLLTNKDFLPAETYDEVVRLTESQFWEENLDIEIFVLGGPAAISEAVVDDLKTVPGATNVQRVYGADRFETAAEIATLTADIDGLASTAFVVSGYSWADAIAAAPVAGYNTSPVFMTKADDVPDVTMDAIADQGITSVVVVGGTSVVGNDALDELRSELGTANVEVLAGDTRYETARLVAQYGVDEFGMRDTTCQLVSGVAFPDALASASMAAMTEAPTLLTRPDVLSEEVIGFFEDSGSIGYNYNLSDTMEGWGCWVIGGENAVSEVAYEELRDLWMTLP